MDKKQKSFNRRNFLKGIGVASVAVGAGLPLSSCKDISKGVKDGFKEGYNKADEMGKALSDGPVLEIGEHIAIADTDCGKVKGYILHGVYTYLGIPYGADTSGENRFMPPKKHAPWQGILPTVYPGPSAPQQVYPRRPDSYSAFIDHWNYGEIGEDCLYLNVWTPGVGDGRKRPVLFWLHGGGFSNGNAIEQDGYYGENLARQGDIVFVSINHRLNAFGFSDLSACGDKFKYSGNVGFLDMLAALEWVHNNIANFGGDPANVTIMGQSGGGAKVCDLAACPQAKGLVKQGVALSGSAISAQDPKDTRQLGEYILKEAKLSPAEVGKLQQMPWQQYLDLANAAAKKFAADKGGRFRAGFSPVADGLYLPAGHFFEQPLPGSPDIPMIFCSNFNESSPSRTDAPLEQITLPEVVKNLQPRYGDKAQAIVDAYGKVFPGSKPIEIYSLILSNRQGVVRSATAKCKQSAPVWMAWFGFQPPLFDSRMRAFHCLDISFWLLNTDRMYTHSGGGVRPRGLSKKMAAALLAFMQQGDPNGGGKLPQWPKFTPDKGTLMELNDTCVVKDDPDRAARAALPQG
jgi:para-nitrobenzyl esterase